MRYPTNIYRLTRFSAVLLSIAVYAAAVGIFHLYRKDPVAGRRLLQPLLCARAQSRAGWTTRGSRILTPSGEPFVITGVNWYGFETRDMVAHGLYSVDYQEILEMIQRLGYNTIRLPYSNEMWEQNPIPRRELVSACVRCRGRHARDILALIINHAGALGLHVILDNHRSDAGRSAHEGGLWYNTAAGYTEGNWIADWLSVQEWVHGVPQMAGAPDGERVHYLAADCFPTVLGYDLRNEPHSAKLVPPTGAFWGTGDGLDMKENPNPNPFTPACVATSRCTDWRLAAERAGDTLLGSAAARGWAYPLIFVEGTDRAGYSQESYPWGGNLKGVNGDEQNSGAPIVLNAGGSAAGLGPPVYNQLVYSAHEYGPSVAPQPWFTPDTCYRSGCSAASLADVWWAHWAHLQAPGGIRPRWPGHAGYPWQSTGHQPYDSAPLYIGEFGTSSTPTDLYSLEPGSQGQWFTSLINLIQSSYSRNAGNDSGLVLAPISWTYWALNGEDSFAILDKDYQGLASTAKQDSFLCRIQQPSPVRANRVAAGSAAGTLPLPQ